MVVKLNTEVVAQLVTKLQAGLPAAISEINAAVTDGILLDTPPNTRIVDYVPGDSELVAFPFVGIQDFPTRWQDDAGSFATGQVELGIIVFLTHPERRGLARSCRRWEQAVATVALAGRNISTSGYGVTLSQVVPGPTLQREEDPRSWMTWTGVIIRCFVDE